MRWLQTVQIEITQLSHLTTFKESEMEFRVVNVIIILNLLRI